MRAVLNDKISLPQEFGATPKRQAGFKGEGNMGITDRWADDKEQVLRELWAEGHSGSEIGAKLNMSRNAIIGKVHRLGLPGRDTTTRKHRIVTKPARNEEKKQRPKSTLFRTLLERKKANVFAGGTEIVEPEIPEAPGRFTLLQLEDDQCRWASGQDDKGRHLFCGDVKMAGKPYCECHVLKAAPRTEVRPHDVYRAPSWSPKRSPLIA